MSPALKAIVLAALIVPASRGAHAESVFSVNGIGETVIGTDARGMALGGASIATPSPWHVSFENPALLARVKRFSFGAAVVPEIRRIELEHSDKSASYAYFPFVRITHGLPGKITAAAAIGSLHRVSYRLEERRIQGERDVVEVRSGEGGPGFVSFSIARELGARLLVGAELRVLVGTIEDERTLTFVGEPSLGTKDIVKTSFGGEPLGRMGAYVDVGRGIGVGASYQFSRLMDISTTVTARDVEVSHAASDLRYPAMGGLGASIKPNEGTTLTAEWFRSSWGRTGALAGYNGEMVDTDRFSLGVEWKLGVERVVPVRLGYLWRELSYRAAGASGPPVEYAITTGFGLPFRRDNGSIDVAVQVGSRGDLDVDGARERFVRFTISMVGAEVLGHLVPGAGGTP